MDLAYRIVALHGFTGSGEDFEALWSHLDRSPATIWAPELVGHTAPPSPPLRTPLDLSAYRIEAEVARLAACMGSASAVVVGYSMGGRVALHLAAAHPERVRALVLVGASPGLATDAERQARIQADEALALRLLSAPVEAFLAWWAQTPLIATQARIASPWRERLQARKTRLWAEGLAASLRGMGTGAMPPLWDHLPTLTMPTLLLTGAEDPKFTAIAAQMAAQMPRAEHVVLPHAGHCAHLEQPALTGTVLQAFLHRHRASD